MYPESNTLPKQPYPDRSAAGLVDLLFYHLKLHCYIVIELKAGEFKPEHLGQLSFYLTAVDKQIKQAQDAPTIGLLLCKSKNKIVAEYALQNNTQPIGISEYELIKSLPKELSTELPSIEQIENEMETRERLGNGDIEKAQRMAEGKG
jgi:hypothetical protein